MLLELIVENYAVVQRARIRFGAGLNILTGETGSGKSIVVDSLGLLLGARASADMIRSGEQKARVSGVFSLPPEEAIRKCLQEAGMDFTDEDGEIIVEREITANGKSRAFVANRVVTTALLRQLAPVLGDIHGQNEQQQLFSPQTQRQLLDEFGACEPHVAAVGVAFGNWQAVRRKLEELSSNEQEKLRLLDLWLFQRNEIDAVRPKPGEDTALESERKILQNVTRLQESATAAFSALYDAPDSATTQLRNAAKRLDDLLRIDSKLAEAGSALKQASVLAEEAAYALRDYLGHLEADPDRLEDVESRLAALERLKRKYGGALEEVIAFHDEVARKADEVENAGEHRAVLEKEAAAAESTYLQLAEELSRIRASAAAKLSRQVEAELKALAMGSTQFSIEVTRGPATSSGVDEVKFLVSPNRGEELKPMEKIASGGELSRIALALKTAMGLSNGDEALHTLVFDEVDAGVGGAAAAAVGKRLKALSRHNQVICVTHLAQIAGFADHHYAVSKKTKNGRVTTEIEELDQPQRAHEIGRMLSGEHVTPEALRQAEQLMQAGRNQ